MKAPVHLMLWGVWALATAIQSCDPRTPTPPVQNTEGLYLRLDHRYDSSALELNRAWLPTLLNQVEINHCQYYL
jgi:hypothetical protein